MNKIKISPDEFKTLSAYILDVSGIALNAGKEYLIETRLHQIVEEYNCSSYRELYTKSRSDGSKAIEKKIIDAISTNETYFFRDKTPFDLLQHKILPDLIDRRTGRGMGSQRTNIRIWSCASSTGQEIYSIAMIMKELKLDPPKYNIRLVGTDISDAAVARASYGQYNKFEVARGLSDARLRTWFSPDGDNWRIKDEIRATASFKKMNLMKPFTGMGKFDIIFCRNVAIYFTAEDRKKLFQKIAASLEPDGYLIIGSTESLTHDIDEFVPQRYLNSTFYQLKT